MKKLGREKFLREFLAKNDQFLVKFGTCLGSFWSADQIGANCKSNGQKGQE